jgi:hypothetical protein
VIENSIHQMQLRRALDVTPRRGSRSAWDLISEFLLAVLATFGYPHVDEVREELASLGKAGTRLLLLRSLKGLRLETDILELSLLFNYGNSESLDSLDLPVAFQSAPCDELTLTFLVSRGDECKAINHLGGNGTLHVQVETVDDWESFDGNQANEKGVSENVDYSDAG